MKNYKCNFFCHAYRVVYNHWTGLLDSFIIFWHMFGQLVVAIATLNVKYAGEPGTVCYLRIVLYNSLSWHNLYCMPIICLIMKYKQYSTCACSVVVTMYPTSYSHGVS